MVVDFASLDALGPRDHKAYLRTLLYPARLVYSWSMGRIASNDDAVAFPRGLRLKRKVAAWDDDFLASLRHRMNFSPDSPASEPRRA
jgi:hypothetical protein